MPDPVVKTQPEWRDIYLRNVSNRNPDMDVGADSYPWVIASALGEVLAIQSANALAISRNIPLDQMTEQQVEIEYGSKVPRQLESYATGWVTIETAGSGTTIQVGDRLTDPDTKHSYEVDISVNTLYLNGENVPVVSVDPGKSINVISGKKLTWSSVRPGCYASATVWEDTNGNGISGGRDKESLEEWKDRIRDHNAAPAGHGNEADVLALLEDATGRTLSTGEVTTGHGMPVAKGFCYPALMGPGTFGIAIVMKQDDWWRSRIPTSTQLSTVYQYVNAALPKDSILPITLQDLALSVDVVATLNPASVQWADFSPWPSSATRGAGRKVIGTVTSGTSFQIVTDDADYTSETSPVVGQTIGLFDYTTGTFKRKKLLTVTGTGPWAVTVDTASTSASDAAYSPVTGRAVCPWCDALPTIAEAVGRYVQRCGPGQCVDSDPGDGVRQMRVPLANDFSYPVTITQRLGVDVSNSVSAVSGVVLLSASPATITVEGLDLANLYLLTDLGIYAQ